MNVRKMSAFAFMLVGRIQIYDNMYKITYDTNKGLLCQQELACRDRSFDCYDKSFSTFRFQ